MLVFNPTMVAALQEPAFSLRAMQESDLPGVLEAERAAYTYPWTEGIFRDCLRVRYCCLVAEVGGRIIGHGVMSVVVGECHILNVCVHPDFQRRGVGRSMLRRLLALARRQDADTAFLEVRPSNPGAITLYHSEGFDRIGMRPGYYPSADGDPFVREDAVLMARAL